VPRIQQLAALAKAQRAAQAAPAPAGRVAQRSEIAGRLRPRKRAKSSRRAPTVPEKPVSHAPSSDALHVRVEAADVIGVEKSNYLGGRVYPTADAGRY
jgi:hypothetical protein